MKPSLPLPKYLSAVEFLNDHYALRKQSDRLFSYSRWAGELGVSSRSYLLLVLQGKRPLSNKLTEKLIEYFKFSQLDSEYFRILVAFGAAKDSYQKETLKKALLKFAQSPIDFAEVENHRRFLSNPLLPVLQTLLSFDDVKEEPRRGASALGVDLSVFEEACEDLHKMNLVTKEGEQGRRRWIPKKMSWKVPSHFMDISIRKFYSLVLDKAKMAFEKFPFNERRFRNLIVPMNEEEFQDFLQDFEVFIAEQSRKRNREVLNDRRLYNLTFAFFPETERAEGNMKKTQDLEMV